MNVQLLLLLALVGPFCAFTHAIPTTIPTQAYYETTEREADVTSGVTEASKQNTAVFTGPPATEPAAAPAEVTTEAVTEAPPSSVMENTEEPTTPPSTVEASESRITDPPPVETAAPTEPAEAVVQSEATAAAKEEAGEDVVIEDKLSSGQIIGIVIGALLAVVIVIAVVIAVVRRMGKYSP
ncbi:podoplanin [Toxotes jaculatrix]|uniref:podoplanin n=1 Tax=Toxotes jaculatrix TaxID=941984 RepID=UPI001B3AB241|nr:podoplanin [Toxotes jaculatrix]